MTASTKPASLGDIVASATRAERTVTVCVAGSLNAKFDQLNQQLTALTGERSLSLDDPTAEQRRGIAQEMEQLQLQMHQHEHTFTFRALPAKAWSDLIAQHGARPDVREPFNQDTFPLPCVVACLVAINGVEQIVTASELEPLWMDVLNVGQRSELFEAAWEANTGRMSVPFSPLVSATLHSTDES